MTDSRDPWADLERRASIGAVSGVTADTDDALTDEELAEAAINPNAKGGRGGKLNNQGGMPPMMMGGMGGRGGGAAAGPVAVQPGAAPGGAGMGDPSAMAAMNASTAMRGGAPGAGVVAASGEQLGDSNGDGIADRVVAGGIDLDGDGIADIPTGAGVGDVNGDGIADVAVTGGVDVDGDGIADFDSFGQRLDLNGPRVVGANGEVDLNGDGIADVDASGNPLRQRQVNGGYDLDGDGIADVDINGTPIDHGRIPGGRSVNTDGVSVNGVSVDRLGAPTVGRRVSGGVDLDGDGVADVDSSGNPLQSGVGIRQGGSTVPDGVSAPRVEVPGQSTDRSTGNPLPYEIPGGEKEFSRNLGEKGFSRNIGDGVTKGFSDARVGRKVGTKHDGFSVDPATLRKTAAEWNKLSSQMGGVASTASSMRSKFGLVPQVGDAHEKLAGNARDWSRGASTEFDALVGRLNSAAGNYESTENWAVSEAGRTHS